MFGTNSESVDLERADMHQRLADATSDPLARKMHLAMAAEYRRRAADTGLIDQDNIRAELAIEPMPLHQ